mmetsp:Transcript_9781/g.25675  ORF Transcript_9781/g.25675 Transcript_9781/m.25675 type:complete len:210 (+) Transcript_9781:234-863(+)
MHAGGGHAVYRDAFVGRRFLAGASEHDRQREHFSGLNEKRGQSVRRRSCKHLRGEDASLPVGPALLRHLSLGDRLHEHSGGIPEFSFDFRGHGHGGRGAACDSRGGYIERFAECRDKGARRSLLPGEQLCNAHAFPKTQGNAREQRQMEPHNSQGCRQRLPRIRVDAFIVEALLRLGGQVFCRSKGDADLNEQRLHVGEGHDRSIGFLG